MAGRSRTTFNPRAFGRQLRWEREKRELSQADVAKRSIAFDDPSDKVSAPYISMLERAQQPGRPSDAALDAIARGLGMDDTTEIRRWAGIEAAPKTHTMLAAIDDDPGLKGDDKELMRWLYLRLTGQPKK